MKKIVISAIIITSVVIICLVLATIKKDNKRVVCIPSNSELSLSPIFNKVENDQVFYSVPFYEIMVDTNLDGVADVKAFVADENLIRNISSLKDSFPGRNIYVGMSRSEYLLKGKNVSLTPKDVQ